MPKDAARPAPPTKKEIADLKRLAAGIIRDQGNRFIKELMREEGVALGANKEDFERNLTAAIEAGTIRLAAVEGWLRGVEGWGNQHVYLYRLTPAVARDLTEAGLREKAKRAGYGKLWDAATVLAFPDEPQLTSVSFSEGSLRVIWQEASPGWTPVPDKNFEEEEGLDTYEYRAHRKVERRAITRFEAHKQRGLAALFIADPIQGDEHKLAKSEAESVIEKLLNFGVLQQNQFDISAVSRNMDQQNVPTNANKNPSVKTQKARLSSGGAYVEFAAASREGTYADETAVKNVRKAIKPAQLSDFDEATGTFWFQPGLGTLERPLRAQLYGRGHRIRLWAQMNSNEVWSILTEIARYRT